VETTLLLLSTFEAHGTNTTIAVSNKTKGAFSKPDEDLELVSACQAGDDDAFERLVRKYQKRMLNIAYRMIGDYDDACETVQETFLSAYRSIRRFRKEAAFSTWLYGICVNHAKNRLKQSSCRSRYEAQSMDDPVETEDGSFGRREMPSDHLTALEEMERKEIQERVRECRNGLDDEYREVLVLRDIQGFSYDEVRDILGIPDETVKSRLFRARDALKASLKKVFGDL